MAGEISVRIGQRIREARRDLGLNQRELAQRINQEAEADGGEVPVDNQRVSDWERAVNKPNERYMALLARALGKKVAWFYDLPEKGDTPDPFAGEDQLARIEQRQARIEEGVVRNGRLLNALLIQLLGDDEETMRHIELAAEQAAADRSDASDATQEAPEAPPRETARNDQTPPA